MTTNSSPAGISSFLHEDKATQRVLRYHKSDHGIACNYSRGVKDRFSVRVGPRYESGLTEAQALRVLLQGSKPPTSGRRVSPK